MPTLTRRNRAQLFLTNPSKGWNTKASVANMSPEYAPILKNVTQDQNGSFTKRNGWKSLNTTKLPGDATPLSYGEYFDNNGVSQIIFTASDGRVYQFSGAAATERASGNTINLIHFLTNFNNRLIISNGTDTPLVWDGSTIADLTATSGSLPIFKAGVVINRRLHVFGMTTSTREIRGSGRDDHQVWTTTTAAGGYSLRLDREFKSGDIIRAVDAFYDNLIIYGSSNIVGYQTDVDAEVLAASMRNNLPGQGAVSANGVSNPGRFPLFWSLFGIKSLTSKVTAGELELDDDISDPIDNYIAEKVRAAIDNGLRDYLTIQHYPKKSWIILNCPVNSDATEFEQFIYHYQFKAWVQWTGINTRTIFVASDGTIYGGIPGYVIQLDTGTNDNGKAIDSVWQTPWLYLRDGTRIKMLRNIEYTISHTKTTEFFRNLQYDFSSSGTQNFNTEFSVTGGGTLWGVGLWGQALWGANARSKKKVQARGRGYAVRHLLRNNKADQPFTLELMRMDYLEGGTTR